MRPLSKKKISPPSRNLDPTQPSTLPPPESYFSSHTRISLPARAACSLSPVPVSPLPTSRVPSLSDAPAALVPVGPISTDDAPAFPLIPASRPSARRAEAHVVQYQAYNSLNSLRARARPCAPALRHFPCIRVPQPIAPHGLSERLVRLPLPVLCSLPYSHCTTLRCWAPSAAPALLFSPLDLDQPMTCHLSIHLIHASLRQRSTNVARFMHVLTPLYSTLRDTGPLILYASNSLCKVRGIFLYTRTRTLRG